MGGTEYHQVTNILLYNNMILNFPGVSGCFNFVCFLFCFVGFLGVVGGLFGLGFLWFVVVVVGLGFYELFV